LGIVKEAFVTKKRHAKTLAAIAQANAILEEYSAQGFRMTVRQLFYQHVTRGLVPNTEKGYRHVGDTARRGRMDGLIDWDIIEDRSRETTEWVAWSDPAAAVVDVAERYQEDLWADQPIRPVVWIEKAALANLIEQVCYEWRTPYFAIHGYDSISDQYKTAKKLAEFIEQGVKPIVLHLGDHDPSGLDMTRDNMEKLALFGGTPIEVRRLALNIDQVRRYRLPPNTAKEKDKRSAAYKRQYGSECWESDALEPAVIETLLSAELRGLVNKRKWKAALAREAKNRKTMEAISDHWDEVEQQVDTLR
jgi:hypothetical protein